MRMLASSRTKRVLTAPVAPRTPNERQHGRHRKPLCFAQMNPYHIAFWEDQNLLWNRHPWLLLRWMKRRGKFQMTRRHLWILEKRYSQYLGNLTSSRARRAHHSIARPLYTPVGTPKIRDSSKVLRISQKPLRWLKRGRGSQGLNYFLYFCGEPRNLKFALSQSTTAITCTLTTHYSMYYFLATFWLNHTRQHQLLHTTGTYRFLHCYSPVQNGTEREACTYQRESCWGAQSRVDRATFGWGPQAEDLLGEFILPQMAPNTFLPNLKYADNLFLRGLQRPASRTAHICG